MSTVITAPLYLEIFNIIDDHTIFDYSFFLVLNLINIENE